MIKSDALRFWRDVLVMLLTYELVFSFILIILKTAEKNLLSDIKIIEWHFPANAHEKIRTSKELVLKQVITGLNDINEVLNTNYKLSRIYFSPFDSDLSSAYSLLICKLIRHYHDGKKFINNY